MSTVSFSTQVQEHIVVYLGTFFATRRFRIHLLCLAIVALGPVQRLSFQCLQNLNLFQLAKLK